LQWIDKEGKTPLMVASMRPDLLNVAKVLVELGANVNAYRPGMDAFSFQLNVLLYLIVSIIIPSRMHNRGFVSAFTYTVPIKYIS
jgi:hypothetical protein